MPLSIIRFEFTNPRYRCWSRARRFFGCQSGECNNLVTKLIGFHQIVTISMRVCLEAKSSGQQYFRRVRIAPATLTIRPGGAACRQANTVRVAAASGRKEARTTAMARMAQERDAGSPPLQQSTMARLETTRDITS